MKASSLFLIGFIVFVSCANPKPRKPVTHRGDVDMSRSVQYNQNLYKREMLLFESFVKEDTTHTFKDSQHGFWYANITEKPQKGDFPKKGDEVVFSYEIKTVQGNIIYSKEELGAKTYFVDQQDFMQGIQEGIKLMKVDEKFIFLLPSLKAYGVYGDGDRIKTSTPLVVTIELLSIQNNN